MSHVTQTSGKIIGAAPGYFILFCFDVLGKLCTRMYRWSVLVALAFSVLFSDRRKY